MLNLKVSNFMNLKNHFFMKMGGGVANIRHIVVFSTVIFNGTGC